LSMNLKIADIRRDYSRKKLSVSDTLDDPLEQLENWVKDAIDSGFSEPTAMCLSTADESGHPSSRMVLLKGVADNKLFFYTNYDSQKGNELEKNPHCSITFFWPEIERQVNLSGKVARTSAENSDLYFKTRPRASQIGAWISPQSRVIPSRTLILKEFVKFSARYIGQSVPRPPFWGGYEVIPDTINFWQGRPSRLHDRIRFSRNKTGIWIKERIAP
jgi:pyridoxamine 5'-phosphate oxidase